MGLLSPLPAIGAVLVAYAAASILARTFGLPTDQGRFRSIDGLRGYLALFVFLHHEVVWQSYMRTGQWTMPPSNLYTHLGQSSVALFFMITGFLFFSKILEGREKNIDWGRLFISRVLRLTPLYCVLMVMLFGTVAVLSRGQLNQPFKDIIRESISWLSFTIAGRPNINAVPQTDIIVASVVWSLPYEWAFYLSLPLLAISVRARTPSLYVIFSITCLCFVLRLGWHPVIFHLFSFLGGVATSALVRSANFCRFASTRSASLVILICLIVLVAAFPNPRSVVAIGLLSLAFALIACGNSLFGILWAPASRLLGDISYSIYLLHGIMLYLFFHFALGVPKACELAPLYYWLVAGTFTAVLVPICFASFRIFERPAIRNTSALVAWLRKFPQRSPK